MFAVKRYAPSSTPVVRPRHRRHLGRRRTLKVSRHPKPRATFRPEERGSDLCWRVYSIERRFEKARGGRGPSSLKPLIVVCREV
jgi:hypothetical protein